MGDLPAVIVAWKSVGTSLPRSSDERLAEDWNAVGNLLVWMEGHGGCEGWTFDPHTQRLACSCGADLYEVTDPIGAAA
jgi:hypothetical protein